MKTKTGTVISDKMERTIVVEVHFYKSHPKYKKKFRVTKKFMADNPGNKCKIGDTVTIYETRPLSKRKRWTVTAPEQKQEKAN